MFDKITDKFANMQTAMEMLPKIMELWESVKIESIDFEKDDSISSIYLSIHLKDKESFDKLLPLIEKAIPMLVEKREESKED